MEARGRVTDERGITLIELMVSFFLLSIILSAVAASLITFTRATSDNERRIEATALVNRLHEELQATPWFDAVLYEGELAELTNDETGIVDDLDGRPLVTVPGPSLTGCDSDEPECNRRARVPRPYLRFDRNGVRVADDEPAFFEAFQAITWADGSEQVKRFTTVIRWEVLERELEERFESERTATAAEAGDPTLPRVVQFQVGPSPMNLHPDDSEDDLRQRNIGELRVVVRFSEPIDSAELIFYQAQTPATDASGNVQLQQVTRELTPELFDDVTGKPFEFRTTLEADTYRFPDGSRNFHVEGTLGTEKFRGTTSASFRGGGLPCTPDPDTDDAESDVCGEEEEEVEAGNGEPPAEPVRIGTVTVTPSTVCMDAEFRFKEHVTISASVEGMTTEDYDVAVSYETVSEGGANEGMQPLNPDLILPSGATFMWVLAEGRDHGFRPQGAGVNEREQVTFKINATRRSDDGSDGPVVSETFTATRHGCGS